MGDLVPYNPTPNIARYTPEEANAWTRWWLRCMNGAGKPASHNLRGGISGTSSAPYKADLLKACQHWVDRQTLIDICGDNIVALENFLKHKKKKKHLAWRGGQNSKQYILTAEGLKFGYRYSNSADVILPILKEGWHTARQIADILDTHVQWVTAEMRVLVEEYEIEEERKVDNRYYRYEADSGT